MIHAILPFHRPKDHANAIANIERLGLHTIVVENGAGIGHDWPRGVRVLRSGPSVTKAMNAALWWLKSRCTGPARPEDWWLKIDADDVYTEAYPAYMTSCDSDGAVQMDLVFRNKSGRVWLSMTPDDHAVMPGCSLAGRVGTTILFDETLTLGEGAKWIFQMESMGKSIRRLRSRHMFHVRSHDGQHTADTSDEEMLMSPNSIFDLGEYTPDLIDRVSADPYGQPRRELPRMPFRFTETRAWRDMSEDTKSAFYDVLGDINAQFGDSIQRTVRESSRSWDVAPVHG